MSAFCIVFIFIVLSDFTVIFGKSNNEDFVCNFNKDMKNDIHILHSGSLNCLVSLKELALAHNVLSVIENGTFNENLKKLVEIYLVNNSLEFLDSSLLSILHLSDKVKININISRNMIRGFTNSANITIENISLDTEIGIDLTHNNMTTFDLDYYRNMFNVSNVGLLLRLWNSGFDARFNPFICDCALYPMAVALRNFYHMDQDNPVFSINCETPAILEGMLVRKVRLNQFNCTVNHGCPDGCTCTNTFALKLITVSCKDRYMAKDLPTQCTEANNISLKVKSSSLVKISPRKYLKNVSVFDVSESEIAEIDPLIIDVLESSAIDIQLHDNALESIPRRFESFNFSEGQTLTIHGNPFNCDCHLVWIKKWIKDNEVNIKFQVKILCASGPGKGKKLIEVPRNKFTCTANYSTLSYFLAVTVCIVVIVFMTLLIALNRKRVQIFLISHFDLCKHCCRKKTRHPLLYDIFIAYVPEDYEIAREMFCYLIENSYKVCFEERDLTAGKSIFDNMRTGIEYSHTTLLLVSNNFLRSGSHNMAFKGAHIKFFEYRNMDMVMVLLAELEPDLIYEELTFYMDTHGFIRYKDRGFWGIMLHKLPVMLTQDDISETSPLI